MTDASAMSPATAKRTVGEELYLVHLRRGQHHHEKEVEGDKESDVESEDDHDYEPPRKRSRSIGEELFSVHLKRSEGLEPDYDIPKEEEETQEHKEERGSALKEEGKKPKSDTTDGVIHHLRNRDVAAASQ